MPFVSVIKLSFMKGNKKLSYKLELSKDSTASQKLPLHGIKESCCGKFLRMMSDYAIGDIDFESYFAIRWEYQFNHSSKQRPKKGEHPSILVYYKFNMESSKLKILGLQFSKYSALNRWSNKQPSVKDHHLQLSKLLNSLVEYERDERTKKLMTSTNPNSFSDVD